MKVSGCVDGRGLDRQEFVRAVQAALEGGRCDKTERERKRLTPFHSVKMKCSCDVTNALLLSLSYM